MKATSRTSEASLGMRKFRERNLRAEFLLSQVSEARLDCHNSAIFTHAAPILRNLSDGDSFSYFPSVASIAVVTSAESGFTAGSNRATGLPLRSKRNLVKFHLMSPPICGFADLLVRNW